VSRNLEEPEDTE